MPEKYNVKDVRKVQIGGVGFNDFIMVLFNDGNLYAIGENCQAGQIADRSSAKTFVRITRDVRNVFCGGYHSSILKNDGKLYSLGFNNDGRCGVGKTQNQVRKPKEVPRMQHKVAMASNGCFGTLLTNDGKVYVAGGYIGNYRQVKGTQNKFIKKIVAGLYQFIALDSDGKLYTSTRDYCEDDTLVEYTTLADKYVVDIGLAGRNNYSLILF